MSYPSDLSDAEWAFLAPLVEPPKQGRGRPRLHPLRPQVDALLYVLTTGCQWRALPNSFPHWTRCYDQFRRWRDTGKFEAFFKPLLNSYRRRQGRRGDPHLLVFDTQTVQTAPGNAASRKKGAYALAKGRGKRTTKG
jgi:putative transposase